MKTSFFESFFAQLIVDVMWKKTTGPILTGCVLAFISIILLLQLLRSNSDVRRDITRDSEQRENGGDVT